MDTKTLPTVTAIMLVNGRHAMVAQAVQSFLSQSYPRELRKLLIWDTGEPKYAPPFVYDPLGVEIWQRSAGPSIGLLRNAAIEQATGEVIVTMDSDDISGRYRIAEQVALLQQSGSDVVGFNEVVFWAESRTEHAGPDPKKACMCGRDTSKTGLRHDVLCPKHDGTHRMYGPQAWLYSDRRPNYAIGASLCFTKAAWKRRPFADGPRRPNATGEDFKFLAGLNCVACSSLIKEPVWNSAMGLTCVGGQTTTEPRLLCRIHGGAEGNSQDYSAIWNPKMRQTAFTRAPQFDAVCREVFESEAIKR